MSAARSISRVRSGPGWLRQVEKARARVARLCDRDIHGLIAAIRQRGDMDHNGLPRRWALARAILVAAREEILERAAQALAVDAEARGLGRRRPAPGSGPRRMG
mgnify:CR=1 FL=1